MHRRFEKVLGCRGVSIPRQMVARWVVRCGERFQLLLNLMRDTWLASRFIHCDEAHVQVCNYYHLPPIDGVSDTG